MVLPLFSGRLASWIAAWSAALEEAAGSESVLILYRDDLAIHGGVQNLRHEARADALDLMGAGSALAEHRGAGRPIVFLQIEH